ncbi:phosphatase PAP2 family protein [Thiomicrorhabdus indica]|uniref:phosphatase PAP2 family protein n=1 Tax=Thiomicrorhabdus indica TaxID=2267253 RepID=UPI002AA74E03|nr:phosphatase PAP2 family protein [Thiomicrorhabdus indica]
MFTVIPPKSSVTAKAGSQATDASKGSFFHKLNKPPANIAFMKSLFFTLFALLVSVSLFEWSALDFWIQTPLYDFQSHQWWLDRNDALTKLIFYNGVKVVFGIFLLSLIALWLFSFKFKETHFLRQKISIVILSCIVVPLTVNGLKASTHIPCPKNLQTFEGTYPHKTLLNDYPANFSQNTNIRCYPAGHASGAFALLSLFFLFSGRKQQWLALSFALGLGWTLGIYKMLIGDHFFSHTLTSMIWAWLCILLIQKMVLHGNLFKQAESRTFKGKIRQS